MVVVKRIFTFSGPVWFENPSMILFSFFSIFVLIAVEWKQEFYKGKFSILNNENRIIRRLAYATMVILILLLGVFDGGQFIYFQF